MVSYSTILYYCLLYNVFTISLCFSFFQFIIQRNILSYDVLSYCIINCTVSQCSVPQVQQYVLHEGDRVEFHLGTRTSLHRGLADRAAFWQARSRTVGQEHQGQGKDWRSKISMDGPSISFKMPVIEYSRGFYWFQCDSILLSEFFVYIRYSVNTL